MAAVRAVIAVLFVLALSACGGTTAEPVDPEAAAVTATSVAEERAAEATAIVIAMPTSEATAQPTAVVTTEPTAQATAGSKVISTDLFVDELDRRAHGRVYFSDPAQFPPERDGVIRVRGSDIRCFDTDKAGCGWWGYSTHFDTLTHWNRDVSKPHNVHDRRPLPELAESWHFRSPTSVMFKLREGVKFHDRQPMNGRELVADDVKYSFERSLNRNSKWAAALGPLSNVMVLGDHEIQFTFESPYPSFMSKISHAVGYPIRAQDVGDEFGGFDTFDAMIGTGPYMMGDYEVGAKQQFVRNENYFRGPNGTTGQELPFIASFNVLVIPNEAAAVAAYLSGLLDHGPAPWGHWGFENVSFTQIQTLSDRPYLVYHHHYSSIVGFADHHYGPKLEGIWANRKLRWAVAMYNDISCMNWCQLSSGYIDTRWVVPSSPWFLPSAELNPVGQQFYTNFPEPTLDLDKARQYLMEAKQELGLPLDEPIKTSLTIDGTDHGMELIAREYIEDLSKIGFEVELIVLDSVEIDRVRRGDFTGLAMWHVSDKLDASGSVWLDPDTFFYKRYHSESVSNFMGLIDPVLDALIDQGRSVQDSVQRMLIYHEIQRHLADMQYDFAVPNGSSDNVFPEWVRNPGPQLAGNPGDMWLQAWVDMNHPARQSYVWE